VAAGGAEALPGYDALQAGDVIYSLNDEPAPSLAALRVILAQTSGGGPLVLHVERAGELRYIAVEKQ
jgi:S1-C subfamily serine protease